VRDSTHEDEMARTGEHVVLLVEDHADIREAMAATLEAYGYHVRTAANGRLALAILDRGLAPSAIVLDLMMPVMDGYEFRRRQLATPGWASIPTLVVSAHGPTGDEAGDLAVEDWLQKPVDPARLLERLAGLVGGSPALDA